MAQAAKRLTKKVPRASTAQRPKSPQTVNSRGSSHGRSGLVGHADGYVGWSDFRESGGEILAEIARKGGQRSVGTGRTTLQMRLRPAEKHPDEAAKVREEHTLRFTAAKGLIHQVRALVAVGVPFILISKGNARVLADRHPSYDAAMVDAHIKRIRSVAKTTGGREMAKAILTIIEALQAKNGKRLKSRQTEVPFVPASKQTDEWNFPPELQRAIDEASLEPEQFIQMLRQWSFHRGADAQVAEATRPTSKDLDGFRED